MPNLTIAGQSFELGYFARITNRPSKDGKWNEKVVSIYDHDSLEIIGKTVCSFWQRLYSLFLCCCGSSDEYFAEIGSNWLAKAKGVTRIGYGEGYSYVLSRTKIVADSVLNSG